MLEKAIEQRLTDEIKRIGGRSYKWESPGNNGVPDRIVVLPKGRIYFIELKKPRNGRTAALQKLQHARLKELGTDVRLIKNLEQVEEFIKEVQQ